MIPTVNMSPIPTAVLDQIVRTEEELRATQSALNKALEDNRMLMLLNDQLRWERDRLQREVDMLTLDLGMKNDATRTTQSRV